ncbi:hypothetical protein ABDD95_23530 [Mucilaginibacter sp. PAMB04274]|uniref:hypothetical protein n=1 Tax=Mucilaginibacter sp. PAMB04274 TaxID=3138568 RepID=UPI0031F6CF6F
MTETDGLLVVYRYDGCEIDFDKSYLNSVSITKDKWAFYMMPNEKAAHAFRVKESISSLKPFFPKSWKNHQLEGLALMVKDNSGEIDPYIWITFMTDENQLSTLLTTTKKKPLK